MALMIAMAIYVFIMGLLDFVGSPWNYPFGNYYSNSPPLRSPGQRSSSSFGSSSPIGGASSGSKRPRTEFSK